MNRCVLEVESLHFGWSTQPLFAGLTWQVPEGVSLVRGGDGRGKTTLMRLLSGTLVPARGRLCANGVEWGRDRDAYQSRVFWVDPETHEYDSTPVSAVLDCWRQKPACQNALEHDWLEGLALGPHLDKTLHMLSAGSRRKVWLLAGVLSGADVTLLDKPFAALDAASCRFVCEALTQQSARQPHRAWVIADYEAPPNLVLTSVLDLGD